MSLAPLILIFALQTANPADEYQRGRTAFERGEWARAIEILRPLIEPQLRLESEGEIVVTHRMLAVAYLFAKKNDLAAHQFRRLLQLRPAYRMDPLLDPQPVVDFFNNILKEQQADLEDMSKKRRQAEAEEKRRQEAIRLAPIVIERRFVRNSFAVNFLPFGAGQFQNGDRKKGWFFLTTEAALAGTSLAALGANFLIFGSNPRVSCKKSDSTAASERQRGCGDGMVPDDTRERTSQIVTGVQVVSGALFFGVAAWGLVDALVNFRPEVPLGESPVGKSSRVQLAPTFLGIGAPGGQIAFRF